MTALNLIVGNYLFMFESQQDWVDNAQRFYNREEVTIQTAIAVNTHGNICMSGRDFRESQERGAYPIRVYKIRAEETRL